MYPKKIHVLTRSYDANSAEADVVIHEEIG